MPSGLLPKASQYNYGVPVVRVGANSYKEGSIREELTISLLIARNDDSWNKEEKKQRQDCRQW